MKVQKKKKKKLIDSCPATEVMESFLESLRNAASKSSAVPELPGSLLKHTQGQTPSKKLSAGVVKESFARTFWPGSVAVSYKEKYIAVTESAWLNIFDAEHMLKVMRIALPPLAHAADGKDGRSSREVFEVPSPFCKLLWVGPSILYLQRSCGASFVVSTHLVEEDEARGPSDDDDDNSGEFSPVDHQLLCRAHDACGITFGRGEDYCLQLGRDHTLRCFCDAREVRESKKALLLAHHMGDVIHVPLATRLSASLSAENNVTIVLVGPACAHVFRTDKSCLKNSFPPVLLREVLFGGLVDPICVEASPDIGGSSGRHTLVLFFRQQQGNEEDLLEHLVEGPEGEFPASTGQVALPPLNCVDRRSNNVSLSLLSSLVIARGSSSICGHCVAPEGVLIETDPLVVTPVVVESSKYRSSVSWQNLSIICWFNKGILAVDTRNVSFLRMQRPVGNSVVFSLERQTLASALPKRKHVADIVVPHDAGDIPTVVQAIVGEQAGTVEGAHARKQKGDLVAPPPTNGFVEDPSRLFFQVDACALEPLALLEIEDPSSVSKAAALNEADVRRIVQEVVRQENAHLLQAIERLLIHRQ